MAENKPHMDHITPFITLDLGRKRIGVASINRLKMITPLPRIVIEGHFYTVLKRHLDRLIDTYSPKGWLIGLPIQPNGLPSAQTAWVEDVIAWLKTTYTLPVWVENEVLTSVEGHERLHQLGLPMKKHKDYIDSVSAMIVAESFLNKQKS
jgi:putative holliday junction resolvase